MAMTVRPSGQACGATVIGVDLSKDLGESLVADIRQAWIEHGVLAFPDQSLSDDDLERFTGYFGDFGEDPFVQPIPGENISSPFNAMPTRHPLYLQRHGTQTGAFKAIHPLAPAFTGLPFPRPAETRCLPTSTWRLRKCLRP